VLSAWGGQVGSRDARARPHQHSSSALAPLPGVADPLVPGPWVDAAAGGAALVRFQGMVWQGPGSGSTPGWAKRFLNPKPGRGHRSPGEQGLAKKSRPGRSPSPLRARGNIWIFSQAPAGIRAARRAPASHAKLKTPIRQISKDVSGLIITGDILPR